ncbi:hypothetical protein Cgig2_001169 [Carnegiea gigantea]|uniref:Uncharacterized protein n=1 Tax=Carnegiea gigantea TaxID=171969 RepID=A0A9Q1Q7T4_9CARY|nr:hypothetical protein Cgig2_001169 [Carnegiea gigantea]
MYITLDSLKNMARVKKNPNYSSHIVRQSMTKYEKQHDGNIESHNRKKQRRYKAKRTDYGRRGGLYTSEDERVDAELENVAYDYGNFTMHGPTLERQATLRNHPLVKKRMHAQLDAPVRQVMRTRSIPTLHPGIFHLTQTYAVFFSSETLGLLHSRCSDILGGGDIPEAVAFETHNYDRLDEVQKACSSITANAINVSLLHGKHSFLKISSEKNYIDQEPSTIYFSP